MPRDQFEGDEAGRCGGCGSRALVTAQMEGGVLHGKCIECGRFQDVETRDWPEATPCDDCAFRKGSPEREDPYRWAEIMETVENGQMFHCHKGLPHDLKTGRYEAPHPDKGRVTVCAGWLGVYEAHMRKTEISRE